MKLAKKDLAGPQKGAWGLGGSLAAAPVKENSQHCDEGNVSHTISLFQILQWNFSGVICVVEICSKILI